MKSLESDTVHSQAIFAKAQQLCGLFLLYACVFFCIRMKSLESDTVHTQAIFAKAQQLCGLFLLYACVFFCIRLRVWRATQCTLKPSLPKLSSYVALPCCMHVCVFLYQDE